VWGKAVALPPLLFDRFRALATIFYDFVRTMSRSEASGTEPRSKSYSISAWANEAAPINASLGQRTAYAMPRPILLMNMPVTASALSSNASECDGNAP